MVSITDELKAYTRRRFEFLCAAAPPDEARDIIAAELRARADEIDRMSAEIRRDKEWHDHNPGTIKCGADGLLENKI